LAGGGLAGIWRQRVSGRSITITVTSWRRLSKAERAELADEAHVVGSVRGADRSTLVID
jgi:hypothetical protein